MYKMGYYYHKHFNLYVLFILFSFCGFSQSKTSQTDFWNNVSYGGGVGLSFGNNYHNISIAPSAIYKVNDNFSTGIGLSFNSAKFNPSTIIAYGASINNYYSPVHYLQLSAEFEELHVHKNFGYDGANITDDYWYPALFFGLGYRAGNVTIGLRYDVLYDENKSIYVDPYMPFVRVYF